MDYESLGITDNIDLLEINPYVRYIKKITNTSDEHHVPERFLYDFSLIFVLDGELNISFGEDRVTTLKTGDVHLMPPLVTHKEYIREGMSCTYFVIHFDMFYTRENSRWTVDSVYIKNCRADVKSAAVEESLLGKARENAKLGIKPTLIHVNRINEMLEILDAAGELYERTDYTNRTASQEMRLKAYMLEILTLLFDRDDENVGDYHSAFINKFIEYAFEHYADAFDYEKVVENFGFTRNYFRKIFKAAMGVTPCDFIKNVRIKRAKRLLSRSDKSVTEIAASVGYPDPLYFSKCFKKDVGCSPTDYRLNYVDLSREFPDAN